MAATLASGVITLSGAWNLSEMVGIAGVTRVQAPGLRYFLDQYTLSGVKLKITGTGAVSRNQKLIFTGQAASAGVLDIDGGTLAIDQPYTLNAFSYSLPQEALVFALSSDGSWNTQVLWVRNAGKLICSNALIRIPHSIWFDQTSSGQVLIENSVIDKTGSTGDIQTNHAGVGNNNTVIRNSVILCDGQSGVTFRNGIAPTMENVAVYQARDAWNNESNSYKVVRGLVPDTGSLADISQAYGNSTVAVNPQKGSQFKWGGHLENSTANYGVLAVYQEVSGSIKTTAGAAVAGAVRYIADTAVAADPAQTNVPTKTGALIDPRTRRVYIQTSDGSGTFAQQDILIGTGRRSTGGLQFVGGDSNRIRPRGKNTSAGVDATDDVYDYTDLAYGFLSSTNPIALKSGNGSALGVFNSVLTDPNVTLTETAAVAKLASSFTVSTVGAGTITVTANSTYDDLYDALKAFKTRPVQAQVEFPSIGVQPVRGVGSALVTDMKIIVNPGVTLSAGAKFKTLSTTGTVTIASGTSITDTSIIGNVIQATPTNLTNVTITGNLTYSTGTSLSITLTNSTVSGTVSNAGAGIISIVAPAGAVGVYGAGTVYVLPTYTLTIAGIQPGSDVVVLAAGTSTVLGTGDQAPGTSWGFEYQSIQAVDIGVIKPGFVPLYVRNYSLTAANSTFPVLQSTDRNFL